LQISRIKISGCISKLKQDKNKQYIETFDQLLVVKVAKMELYVKNLHVIACSYKENR